jgi:Uma2 family endonuclease
MIPAEYLAWEAAQSGKHQYLRGEVFAMAGASPRHNRLSARVLAALEAALRAGPCAPFTSDQKIHIPRTGNFVYPDASVVCGPVQLCPGSSDVIENPRVVVEVLSKGTEQHDRGDKWEDYQSLSTLTDYVLIAQRVARIEHFARETDGVWRYRVAGVGGRLALTVGAEFVVDELYDGTFEFPGDP